MNCGRERAASAPGPGGEGAAPPPAAPPAPGVPPAAPPPAAPPGPPPAGSPAPPAYVPGQAPPYGPGQAPPYPAGGAVAPPPMYPPGPVAPSPAAEFLRRAFRGAWAPALRAAAWPTGLLLALAVALAIPSYGQDPGDDVVVGWSGRLRIALALLLQAFGGGFELRAVTPGFPYDDGDGSGFHSGGYGYGSDAALAQGGAELSLVPLTVTFLWTGALYLAARGLRARGAGVDAAVRVALPAAGAVLLLGLFAQPEIAGVAVSASPVTAALVALVLALAVTAGVLQRDDLARWLAARPGAFTAVRALGAATRALGTALALCAVVGFLLYAGLDGVDGTGLLLALTILPNLGAAVLGISWGAPLEYDLRGRFGLLGSGAEHGTVGLGEVGDEWGGGAVAGLLALGAVCALTAGLWAARRVAGRGGQALAGGLFLALYLLVTGASGVGMRLAGEAGAFGGAGHFEIAPSVPDALLFGLLWVAGGVLVAPYLLRRKGGTGGPGGPGGPGWGGTTPPQVPPQQGHPTTPPFPAPTGPAAPGPTHTPGSPPTGSAPTGPAPGSPQRPDAPPPGGSPAGPAPGAAATAEPTPAPAPARAPRRGRGVLLWGGALVVAFTVGGGVTTGILMLKEESRPGLAIHPRPDAEPVADPVTGGPTARTAPAPESAPAPEPTSAPETTPAPDATPAPAQGPTAPPTVPDGYELAVDTAGFAFAVPAGWERISEKRGQITYAGPTGTSHFLVGVVRDAPYTSLENLTNLEGNSRAKRADYRRVRLEANTFQGRPGAIWEYTYTDEAGETIHAVDQSYIADDGTEYAVYFTARERDWSEAREAFDTALATWTLNDAD
ncbi:hypothetical protein [Streptomyces thermolilacinus]|uniref:Uncharacterized protein n=1 Tax=Streptomyces thermolilacinus SPC6 TaxID=1306406 RepID=A0A1D3DRJ9_9ACTN|nr:hypothetical protein J116_011060 [Streptomyces thermolilacinus SPC6]